MIQTATIQFDSIEEWIDTVKNGKLDDHQLATANKFFEKDSNGNILICDFSDIKVPVHPKGFECNGVGWSGRYYSYYIENVDGVFAYVHYIGKDAYEDRFEDDYLNFFDQDHIFLKKVIEGKDATEYYYSTDAGELKSVRYSLANGDTTRHIEETYRLEMKDSYLEESSEIPSSIYIYGSGPNGYFVITIYGLKNRPNVEWLEQFGVRKYKQ